MNSREREALLIDDASKAVKAAMQSFGGTFGEVPFCKSTDFGMLSADEQVGVHQTEMAHYRDKPDVSAVHFCLTSAQALLEISQTLLHQADHLTPVERERSWKRLAEDAKVAGRAAYRAVLILSDPSVARVASNDRARAANA
jgi:hypothetical protein